MFAKFMLEDMLIKPLSSITIGNMPFNTSDCMGWSGMFPSIEYTFLKQHIQTYSKMQCRHFVIPETNFDAGQIFKYQIWWVMIKGYVCG